VVGYTLTGSPATFTVRPTAGYTITGSDAAFLVTTRPAGYVLTGFDVSFVVQPVSMPVPPVSLGGWAKVKTRPPRRIRAPDQRVEPALYVDSDAFYAPSIELTEDVVSAPPIQPELPLVELRPVTKALPTDASSPPVSIVSAKPRIATTLRPMIAEPHKVVAGAADAVVNDATDEEIMLILLEAA
jgi:hypothetical protein